MVFIEGIIPRPVLQEMKTPLEAVGPVVPNGSRIRPDYAQPQNHSSRDGGVHPRVNPTARTRRGNKR